MTTMRMRMMGTGVLRPLIPRPSTVLLLLLLLLFFLLATAIDAFLQQPPHRQPSTGTVYRSTAAARQQQRSTLGKSRPLLLSRSTKAATTPSSAALGVLGRRRRRAEEEEDDDDSSAVVFHNNNNSNSNNSNSNRVSGKSSSPSSPDAAGVVVDASPVESAAGSTGSKNSQDLYLLGAVEQFLRDNDDGGVLEGVLIAENAHPSDVFAPPPPENGKNAAGATTTERVGSLPAPVQHHHHQQQPSSSSSGVMPETATAAAAAATESAKEETPRRTPLPPLMDIHSVEGVIAQARHRNKEDDHHHRAAAAPGALCGTEEEEETNNRPQEVAAVADRSALPPETTTTWVQLLEHPSELPANEERRAADNDGGASHHHHRPTGNVAIETLSRNAAAILAEMERDGDDETATTTESAAAASTVESVSNHDDDDGDDEKPLLDLGVGVVAQRDKAPPVLKITTMEPERGAPDPAGKMEHNDDDNVTAAEAVAAVATQDLSNDDNGESLGGAAAVSPRGDDDAEPDARNDVSRHLPELASSRDDFGISSQCWEETESHAAFSEGPCNALGDTEQSETIIPVESSTLDTAKDDGTLLASSEISRVDDNYVTKTIQAPPEHGETTTAAIDDSGTHGLSTGIKDTEAPTNERYRSVPSEKAGLGGVVDEGIRDVKDQLHVAEVTDSTFVDSLSHHLDLPGDHAEGASTMQRNRLPVPPEDSPPRQLILDAIHDLENGSGHYPLSSSVEHGDDFATSFSDEESAPIEADEKSKSPLDPWAIAGKEQAAAESLERRELEASSDERSFPDFFFATAASSNDDPKKNDGDGADDLDDHTMKEPFFTFDIMPNVPRRQIWGAAVSGLLGAFSLVDWLDVTTAATLSPENLDWFLVLVPFVAATLAITKGGGGDLTRTVGDFTASSLQLASTLCREAISVTLRKVSPGTVQEALAISTKASTQSFAASARVLEQTWASFRRGGREAAAFADEFSRLQDQFERKMKRERAHRNLLEARLEIEANEREQRKAEESRMLPLGGSEDGDEQNEYDPAEFESKIKMERTNRDLLKTRLEMEARERTRRIVNAESRKHKEDNEQEQARKVRAEQVEKVERARQHALAQAQREIESVWLNTDQHESNLREVDASEFEPFGGGQEKHGDGEQDRREKANRDQQEQEREEVRRIKTVNEEQHRREEKAESDESERQKEVQRRLELIRAEAARLERKRREVEQRVELYRTRAAERKRESEAVKARESRMRYRFGLDAAKRKEAFTKREVAEKSIFRPSEQEVNVSREASQSLDWNRKEELFAKERAQKRVLAQMRMEMAKTAATQKGLERTRPSRTSRSTVPRVLLEKRSARKQFGGQESSAVNNEPQNEVASKKPQTEPSRLTQAAMHLIIAASPTLAAYLNNSNDIKP